MAEIKKFLDQKGVEHLWSKISMEDYPNNDTLMAVINAIDETKADRNEIENLASEAYVDEAINNNANFYVTVIKRDNGTEVDKTVAEIEEAYQLGKIIKCLYGGVDTAGYKMHLDLVTRYSANHFVFVGASPLDGKFYRVIINSSGATCDMIELAISDEVDTALNNANAYTDSEITEWVGNKKVSEQISTAMSGKSDINHKHSATDITSGILPITRGGTGNAEGYIRTGQKSGTTIGANATAEGSSTTASGDYSHAEGRNTIAFGDYSHAEGRNTIAFGNYSHAEGRCDTLPNTITSDSTDDEILAAWDTSHFTLAAADGSHAEGLHTLALGAFSHAEGGGTKASGYSSHAEGCNAVASGFSSHAEGDGTTASGDYSHVEGIGKKYNITITGSADATSYTLSESDSNKYIKVGGVINYGNVYAKITAYDSTSLTITVDKTLSTTALTDATAKVLFGVAFGYCSHAEGYTTVASGHYSHAEGYATTASNNYSHAEGYTTTASGNYSHAEGLYTVASGVYQHAQGRYNISDISYAHIIGNGNGAKPSNAHTVDWSGNAWYQGDVYVGSTSGTNKDGGSKKLATEEYVDNNPNGTHYDTRGKVIVLNQTEFEYNDDNYAYAYIEALNGFETGATYTVMWDGVEYQCVANDSEIGDYNCETYPFYICAYKESNGPIELEIMSEDTWDWPYDGSTATHTIAIHGYVGGLKQLDNKYLQILDAVDTEYKPLYSTSVSVSKVGRQKRLQPDFDLVEGKKYKVVIDGVEYESVAWLEVDEDINYINVGAIWSAELNDYDYSVCPFILFKDLDNGRNYIIHESLTNYNLEVYSEEDTYEINEKYLPKNIATKEYVDSKITPTSLILADAITGESYTIQIQNGQLVSFKN